MNTLTTLSNDLTMNSREIAALVDIRHDNVRRTVETLANKGVITLPQIEEKATKGRPSLEYIFTGEQGKRDSIIVVAQLCPEFTARLVDRWQELENQQKPVALIPNFDNPIEAAEAWIEEKRKVISLTHEITETKPIVNAYNRIATKAEGSMCITDAAKHLSVKPKFLFDFLSQHHWIYKRAGNANWIAYQDKLQQGLLEHKVHIATKQDGEERVCERVLITAKGIAKAAKVIENQLH